MKKELTNEEILKVLSMNIGGEVTGWYNGLMIKSTITYSNIEGLADRIKMGYGNLLNIPLPKISDKDAIEVAKVYTGNIRGEDDDTFNLKKAGKQTVERIIDRYSNYVNAMDFVFAYQYLASKGYAVPLFFAPNHWANGKTAIELGLAIDATTIKAEI